MDETQKKIWKTCGMKTKEPFSHIVSNVKNQEWFEFG